MIFLKELNEDRVEEFNREKEEDEAGDLQGNPIYDNDEGYYRIQIGDHLCYRYEILRILGKGSFAQVVECIDHKTGQVFAVKVTRNTEMDHKFAHKEAGYLSYIMQEDPKDQHNIVRMTDQHFFR